MKTLESILGPNWRTSLSGGIALIAGAVYANHDLVGFLPPSPRNAIIGIAGLIAILSGGTFAAVSKDRQVTGNGTVFEPHKIAQPDGSNRTIAPVAVP